MVLHPRLAALPLVVISMWPVRPLRTDITALIERAVQAAVRMAIQAVLEGDVWLPEGIADKIERMQSESTDFSERLASLTPQQFRVLGMLAEGLLNKQIAYDLDVSEATIKAHITAVFRKLGVRNRTQAVIAIQQMELDPSEQSLSGG